MHSGRGGSAACALSRAILATDNVFSWQSPQQASQQPPQASQQISQRAFGSGSSPVKYVFAAVANKRVAGLGVVGDCDLQQQQHIFSKHLVKLSKQHVVQFPSILIKFS